MRKRCWRTVSVHAVSPRAGRTLPYRYGPQACRELAGGVLQARPVHRQGQVHGADGHERQGHRAHAVQGAGGELGTGAAELHTCQGGARAHSAHGTTSGVLQVVRT